MEFRKLSSVQVLASSLLLKYNRLSYFLCVHGAPPQVVLRFWLQISRFPGLRVFVWCHIQGF